MGSSGSAWYNRVVKCPLCGARKGKRQCPALSSSICPVCCGERRLVEIACPDRCAYLGPGIENDLKRDLETYLRRQEPAAARRWLSALQNLLPLLDALEGAIVESAASARDLTDAETLSALDALRSAQSSAAAGLIWQPSAVSPRVEMLARALNEAIQGLQALVREKGGSAIPAEAILEAVTVTEERARFHAGQDGGGFVRFLRRTRPLAAPGRSEGAGPRVILAG